VREWCNQRLYDKEQVLFVFEHGDKHQGMLRNRVEDEFGVIIQTEKKKALAPLQTADFSAWELLKVFKKNRSHVDVLVPGYRQSFAALFTQIKYNHAYFGLDRVSTRGSSLDRFCQDFSIPLRVTSGAKP